MKLEGANNFRAKLKQLSEQSQKTVHDIVVANANEMEADAKRRAPDVYKYPKGATQPTNGEINQAIAAVTEGKMKASVSVNSKMGAYAEFGTGAFVDVPKGWEQIAWTYYVDGKGMIMPTPYFYPAFRDAQKRFLDDLRQYLDEATR